MTPTVTRSVFFDYPPTHQFDQLGVSGNAGDRQRRHLALSAEEIDAALRGIGWSSHCTALAAPELVAAMPSPATPEPPGALKAFERIRDQLCLDDQRTAALVGISRNTPRDWRNGNRPKTATTRRLYELAGVFDLVATVEPDMAAWGRRLSSDGRSWLEVAAEPDGPANILAYRRADLLARRPPARLDVASEEEDALADYPGSSPVASDVVGRRPGPRRQAR
ncbi:MAG: hypothetical protein ACYDGN_16670 [Acidimicrobiales bacterium]